jgi:hypothetical protein
MLYLTDSEFTIDSTSLYVLRNNLYTTTTYIVARLSRSEIKQTYSVSDSRADWCQVLLDGK